jgi:hypothetical protein
MVFVVEDVRIKGIGLRIPNLAAFQARRRSPAQSATRWRLGLGIRV